jgi:hypothetical protein
MTLINEEAVKNKLESIVEAQMTTVLTSFVKRDWEDAYTSGSLKNHLTAVVQELYDEAEDEEIIDLQKQIQEKALQLKKLRLKKKIIDLQKLIDKLED